MTNMDAKKKALYALNESARANELNDFYMCFEVDSVSECWKILVVMKCTGLCLTPIQSTGFLNL